jgi:hypothetical protein
MKVKKSCTCMVAAVLAALAGPAAADLVRLDFEGIGDRNAIGSYYGGGAGTNHGVTFSDAAQALVDSDAGGTGDFANEASPDTIMILSAAAPNAVMNHQAGFTGTLSFSYTSTAIAVVHVYSGFDLLGTQVATVVLDPSNDDNCAGDPSGKFCSWTAITMAFQGVAHSIDFRSPAGATGWENVSFDSLAVGAVPEPGTWALMTLGLAGLGGLQRKVRRT